MAKLKNKKEVMEEIREKDSIKEEWEEDLEEEDGNE